MTATFTAAGGWMSSRTRKNSRRTVATTFASAALRKLVPDDTSDAYCVSIVDTGPVLVVQRCALTKDVVNILHVTAVDEVPREVGHEGVRAALHPGLSAQHLKEHLPQGHHGVAQCDQPGQHRPVISNTLGVRQVGDGAKLLDIAERYASRRLQRHDACQDRLGARPRLVDHNEIEEAIVLLTSELEACQRGRAEEDHPPSSP